jgi:hypothetical protein
MSETYRLLEDVLNALNDVFYVYDGRAVWCFGTTTSPNSSLGDEQIAGVRPADFFVDDDA